MNLNVDCGKIGLMGSSMGGFIATGILATNPTVKCIVNFNGSGAWLKAEELIRKKK